MCCYRVTTNLGNRLYLGGVVVTVVTVAFVVLDGAIGSTVAASAHHCADVNLTPQNKQKRLQNGGKEKFREL